MDILVVLVAFMILMVYIHDSYLIHENDKESILYDLSNI